MCRAIRVDWLFMKDASNRQRSGTECPRKICIRRSRNRWTYFTFSLSLRRIQSHILSCQCHWHCTQHCSHSFRLIVNLKLQRMNECYYIMVMTEFLKEQAKWKWRRKRIILTNIRPSASNSTNMMIIIIWDPNMVGKLASSCLSLHQTVTVTATVRGSQFQPNSPNHTYVRPRNSFLLVVANFCYQVQDQVAKLILW